MRLCLHLLLYVAVSCNAETAWKLDNWKELATLDTSAVIWESQVSSDRQSVRLSGVSFQARDCVFRVIDNPPQQSQSLQSALSATNAFAGSNGGYFHNDLRPVGLVISDGRTIHPFERANLLSGILLVRKGRIELVRSGQFKGGEGVQEALQAGPWLIEKGAPVSGLNSERPARRTIVANDGKGQWTLLATSPLTLADAAQMLAVKGVAGPWAIANALNLDGGSSTALRAEAEGRPLVQIPSSGPVRNYLAIIRRHP
jgi:uncharacterized protein YigE (DUF2233 family)